MSTNPDRSEDQKDINPKQPRRFSRRRFLQAASALVGAAALERAVGRVLSAFAQDGSLTNPIPDAELVPELQNEVAQLVGLDYSSLIEQFQDEFKKGKPRFLPESVRAASLETRTYLPAIFDHDNTSIEIKKTKDTVRKIYAQSENDQRAAAMEVHFEHYNDRGEKEEILDPNTLPDTEKQLLGSLGMVIENAQLFMSVFKEHALSRGVSFDELSLARPKKITFLFEAIARANTQTWGNQETGDVEDILVTMGVRGEDLSAALAEVYHWLFPFAPMPSNQNQHNWMASEYNMVEHECGSDCLDPAMLKGRRNMWSAPHGMLREPGGAGLQTYLSRSTVGEDVAVFLDVIQEAYGLSLFEKLLDFVPQVRDRVTLYTLSQDPEAAKEYSELFTYLRLLNLPVFGHYMYGQPPDDNHSQVNNFVRSSPYQWLKNLHENLKSSLWISEVSESDRVSMQKGMCTVSYQVRRQQSDNANSLLFDVFAYRLREDLRTGNLPAFETRRIEDVYTLGNNVRVYATLDTNTGSQRVELSSICALSYTTQNPKGSFYLVIPDMYPGTQTIGTQKIQKVEVLVGYHNPLSDSPLAVLSKIHQIDFSQEVIP